MKNKQHPLRRIALTTLMLAAPLAHAEDPIGFYLGAGIGQSLQHFSDVKCDDALAAHSLSTGCRTSERGLGGKLIGGYSFNPHIAVEGAYLDSNKATIKSPDVDGSQRAQLVNAKLIGKLPIEDSPVSLFGDIGAYYADTKSSGGFLARSSDAKNAGFVFGVGANYAISPTLDIRLEWERNRNAGSDSKNFYKTDLDFTTVGILYTFGG